MRIISKFKLKIQGKKQVYKIKHSEYFDEEWYKEHYNLQTEKNPAYHYLREGWKKGYNPSLKFSTRGYKKNNPNVDICPLLDYELFKKENNRKVIIENSIYQGDYKEYKFYRSIKRKISFLINFPYIIKNRNKKILVCLHLYYYYSFKEIKEYLKNIKYYDYDLVITIPKNAYKRDLILMIKKFNPNARIIKCDNAGYDIQSFINVIRETNLKKYDAIIKLQSKGTDTKTRYCYNMVFKDRDWFKMLYEGILNPFKVHKNLNLLFNDKNVGLVANKDLIINDPIHKKRMLEKNIKENNLKFVEDYKFVAGTCFGIKAELLKEIKKIPEDKLEFKKHKERKMEFSFAHIMERYICFFASEKGMKLYGTKVCKFTRLKWKKIENKLKKLSALKLLEIKELNISDDFAYFFLEGNFIFDYKVTSIKLKEIKREWHGKLYSLNECSPYKYLEGDKESYKKYVEFHKKNNLPIMSMTRFNKLISSIKKNGYDKSFPIILNSKNNIILDGQHRSCILLKLFGEEYEVPVIKITFLNLDINSIKPFSDEIEVKELNTL